MSWRRRELVVSVPGDPFHVMEVVALAPPALCGCWPCCTRRAEREWNGPKESTHSLLTSRFDCVDLLGSLSLSLRAVGEGEVKTSR